MMTNEKLQSWSLNSSRYALDDRWFKLRVNSYTTPDGHTIEPYYIIESEDWANCLVIDDKYDVVMVNHYRPAVDKYIPELVSGGLEPTDNSPEAGMRRELEEEIGYIGGEMYLTGVSYPNPARQTNKMYSFIAIGGSCKVKQSLEVGENLQVIKLPLREFIHVMESGDDTNTIHQSLHLTSIFFALNFIKASQLPLLQEVKRLIED